jgi:hypothetical protein
MPSLAEGKAWTAINRKSTRADKPQSCASRTGWGFFIGQSPGGMAAMTSLSYASRSERVLLRLRPEERQRAEMLAREQEIKVPELIRRLLEREWRTGMAAGLEARDGD